MLKLIILILTLSLTAFSVRAQSYDFEGIVKMSNCSASIIIFNGMPTQLKAILMTNGHCTSRWRKFIPPNEAIINKKIKLHAQVYDAQKNLHPISTTKLLYGTMTGTDLAFYELKETYDELLTKYNVRPLLLDHKRPQIGQDVEVISGYWNKGFSCQIEDFAGVLRESKWSFEDSIRFKNNPSCQMKGGTSGAPITIRDTRLVIGINNTSNTRGRNCTNNNPCEIQGDQIIVRRGVRYGQQTYKIYSCLTSDFIFDFNKTECDLAR